MKEKTNRLNKKSITKRLQEENKFVIDICRTVPGMYLSDPPPENAAGNIKPFKMFGTEKRATSLEDLQRKLQEWKGKRLGFKSRRVKKTIKNKIDKTKKKNARKMKKNLIKGSKDIKNDVQASSKPTMPDNKPTVPDSKPTPGPKFNKEGNMVYSKFDFVESIADQPKQKKKKEVKDPRKILKMIEKQNEVIEKLKESGDVEKATSIKNQQAWKSALDRAQGIKVKDDPKLLLKTMKSKERKKKKSRREWAERNKQVEEKMRQKQEKREANIKKKQKEKKSHKIQKLVKKGRLLPGYSKFE